METMDSSQIDNEDGRPAVDAAPPRITDVLGTMRREVARQAEIRPYTTVVVAAGLGYVLGAGVPRWAAHIATTVGSRLVVAKIVAALVDEKR